MIGRTWTPKDIPQPGAPPSIAVLSYLFWTRHFNADRAIAGRTIELNHQPYTILGVVPPRFTWNDADIYIPMSVTPDPKHFVALMTHVKKGIGLDAVSAELQAITRRFAARSLRHLAATDGNRVSRFSRVKFRCMCGVYDSAVPASRLRISRSTVLPSGPSDTVGASDFDYFGAHQLQGYPACTCPCPTLWLRRCRRPHMARGQDGSLFLSCMTLTFTTSRRFIPTHPDGTVRRLWRVPSTALLKPGPRNAVLGLYKRPWSRLVSRGMLVRAPGFVSRRVKKLMRRAGGNT
jgi:hypothetical protein